jgi:hypothetical protein
MWTQEPMAANKVDGFIYARGSQDMKCVGMRYLVRKEEEGANAHIYVCIPGSIVVFARC